MIFKEKFGKPDNGWVVLAHGLGGYSGRYEKLINMLNKNGFAVYVFDWPGHGKSDGKRGHAKISSGIDAIDVIIEEIGEKPYLFGHSLGGLTVIRYAEIYPEKIEGVIASSPALAKDANISPVLVFLAKLLGPILPTLTVNNRINPQDISRNKKIVKKYVDDPIVHDRISGALSKSIFYNMEKAHQDAGEITVPVLLLGGTGDVIVPLDGARRFVKELKFKDKELKEFEGVYHEIFEDPKWGEVFHKTIIEWIKSH